MTGGAKNLSSEHLPSVQVDASSIRLASSDGRDGKSEESFPDAGLEGTCALSGPGGVIPSPSMSIWSVISGLEPQMPGIVSNYAKFYQVKSGDSCWSIENAAGITLAQFRSWNTQIDESCTNLWVDYYVCIGV
ncbi:conserved hypothetical protein [Aspergillus fumigatus A1163]|uniref:LysM domain-containing protein n=1 Tax=Aspergillus fumigatus (strain CBS 144.89 / FGSC A1163 / CEA10) TaxID=451804 RepID=B0YDT8_ASPFC|nr:conserved hypothetical protein [Aspergillus fumigatus A1163]